MITSLHNPRVKQAARLRDHRQRQKEQRILIDGAREILRARSAGVPFHEVFICPALCRSADARQLLEELPGGEAEIIEVSAAVFAQLTFGQRAEGIISRGPGRPAAGLRISCFRTSRWSAVLEGVEKPGNIGAVRSQCRRGRRFGGSCWPIRAPMLFNPNAIRAEDPGDDFLLARCCRYDGRGACLVAGASGCKLWRPAWKVQGCTRRSITACPRPSCSAAKRPGLAHGGPAKMYCDRFAC